MKLLFCSFLLLQFICVSTASRKPHVVLPVVHQGESCMNECVDAIVKEKYDKAIERFRYTLNNCDSCCRMFSVIQDGLESYEVIRSEDIELECYGGYTPESIQRMLRISDDVLIAVFHAMHDFLKENKAFSFSEFRTYFDKVFAKVN